MKKLILILTLITSPAVASEDQECRRMVLETLQTSQDAWRASHEEIMHLHELIEGMLPMHEAALSRIKALDARVKQLEGKLTIPPGVTIERVR